MKLKMNHLLNCILEKSISSRFLVQPITTKLNAKNK
jgi:hypothetical protein